MFRNFIIIFLLTGAVLTGSITVIYTMETNDYIERIKQDEMYNLKLQKEIIKGKFQSIFSDLLILSRQNELMQLLVTDNPEYRQMINNEYLEFSTLKKHFDQVRFIDHKGWEICRVNYNSGSPEIVPETSLQNKNSRYYFTDTFMLEPGNIFVSPFDLNIENKKIEMPVKPMIRFGTPVMNNQGVKRGVIILNYLGMAIIDTIKDIARLSTGNAMLVNSDGYWLHGTDPDHEWGFMYDHGKDHTFGKAYPRVWPEITGSQDIQLETAQGIFTSTTVYPLQGNMPQVNRPVNISENGEPGIKDNGYHWKIISFVPADVINSITQGLFVKLFGLGFTLFLLAGIPSYLIAQSIVRRKMHQVELIRLANFDKLTGLPNRTLFLDRLTHALEMAKRYEKQFALLFIDLDGFKAVNDSLGHDCGDELLIMTARLLAGAIRKSDTAARLGGDEFTIILTTIKKPDDAQVVAKKILKEMAAPFMIKGHETRIGASIGISLFSGSGETPDTMLKNADKAMYTAKKQGKNTYKVFSETQNTNA